MANTRSWTFSVIKKLSSEEKYKYFKTDTWQWVKDPILGLGAKDISLG